MLATVKPAVVVDGNGLDQHTNVVQTVRTTTMLRSLIGSVDAPGGSVSVPPLPFVDVQRRGRLPERSPLALDHAVSALLRVSASDDRSRDDRRRLARLAKSAARR